MKNVDTILRWPLREGRAPVAVMVLTLLGILLASLLARRSLRMLGHARNGLVDILARPSFKHTPAWWQELLLSLAEQLPAPPTGERSSDSPFGIRHSQFRLPFWQQAISVWLIVALTLGTTQTNVQAQTYDPVFYYYLDNHLGGTFVLMDRLGSEFERFTYTAYGRTQYTHNNPEFPMERHFTGQTLDDETGLYFYNARYYDPELGRFIQPDSVVQNSADGQALNRYSYCRSNPITFTDPTGNIFGIDDAIIWAVVIGAAIGGATAAATGGNIGMGILTGAISGLFGGIGGSLGGFSTAVVMGATSGAINAAITGGDIGMGAFTGAIAGGVSFGVGRGAMRLAKATGLQELRPASLGSAMIQGGTSGAAGGAVGAAINGGNVGEGALVGGTSGAAASGASWGYNRYQAGRFLQNNVRGTVTPEVRQAILDSGQSPIGRKLMDGYMRTGSILEMGLEPTSGPRAGVGPHVLTGSNRLFFDGNIQTRFGAIFANEPWGPSMDDATVFVHELGHTASGFGTRDPLNVTVAENPFRSWSGTPLRNDYSVISRGQPSQPVPSRGFFSNTFHPWY